jgi:phosphoglycolate phosphatase-like HAD superfamily hydrolase
VAVAIATGSYGTDELAAHKPDFLLGDLSDTQSVLAALFGEQ